MNRKQGQTDHHRTTTPSAEGDDGEEWAAPPATNEDLRRLRPLAVLEHLTRASEPLTRAQLARSLGVPKTTLMRLLRAMENRGYVMGMPAERGFVPGPRAINLALRTLRGPNIRRECRSALRELVLKLGETCNLSVPDAGRVLYVERVETTELLRLNLLPGTWVPMHSTASGKLFLASLPLYERRRALDQLQLRRSTPRTLVDRAALEAELARIAQRGVGIDNEEFVQGMVGIAVPVLSGDGRVLAAVACHAPTARRSLDDLRKSVPDLQRAAEAIAPALSPAR